MWLFSFLQDEEDTIEGLESTKRDVPSEMRAILNESLQQGV